MIIQHKDRLLRFGSEIVFYICNFLNIDVIITNDKITTNKEEEFITDVLTIMTVFTSKIYGSRSHKNKRIIA